MMQKINKIFSRVIFAISGFFVFCCTVNAQQALPTPYSGAEPVSFVRTWEAVRPQTNADSFTVGTHIRDARMTTQYVDGLGRPIQTVVKQGSMMTGDAPKDMVSAILYDPFSREQYRYLPFAANSTGGNTSINNGLFKLNPFQQDSVFNKGQFPGETYYYSQTVFEASPLNRVKETFAPGNSWAGTVEQVSEDNRRSIKSKYWINTVADSVRLWKVVDVPDGFGTYSTSARYPAGELYKNVTTDEHGKQVVEFKDKGGLIILKKVQLTAGADTGTGKGYDGWLSTYYIHDSLNRLRCVIQPEGVWSLVISSWSLTTEILDDQCFRYEYDPEGEMIIRKIPGAGAEHMVYDERGRLVMSQDANLRESHKWLVTKYDELNRVVETGIWINDTTFSIHRSEAATSITYPALTSRYELLTLTHYDDYVDIPDGSTNDFDNTWSAHFASTYNAAPLYAQQQTASTQTRGMVTWTKTKVLGTGMFLSSVSIYDDMGRVIQVKETNLLGKDIITTQYDWSGNSLVTVQSQTVIGSDSQTTVIVTKWSRDDFGRVIKSEKKLSDTKINSNEMSDYATVSTLEYDALGQVKSKAVGSKKDASTNEYITPREPLETLKYDYNIRGWVLGMNREFIKDEGTAKFGFELAYDKRVSIKDNYIANTYAKAQYTGNIGGIIWKSIGDGEKRKYDFDYDAANRILKADFTQYTGGWNVDAGIDFSMGGNGGNMKYDANGNILEMWQKGLQISGSDWIDKLSYAYFTGTNKLQGVNDGITAENKLGDFTDKHTGTDYGYDKNGNLVADLNKRINGTTGLDVTSDGIFSYNHLNLPDLLRVFDDNGNQKGKITYLYDATGKKLSKQVKELAVAANNNISTTTETTYINGLVYETKADNNGNTADYSNKLQFLGQEEGRIRFKDSTDPAHPAAFEYDYTIKDHLGNVRMVLTEEQKTDAYPAATMEPGDAGRDTMYYSNINETREGLPGGYPVDNSFSDPNEKVAKVSGSGNKIGPAITLKVMAGDQFSLRVSSWYKKNGATPATPNSPLTSLIAALTSSIGGVATGHATVTELQTNNTLDPGALGFYNTHSTSDSTTKPKAFINWVLFDEQFKYVSNGSGFEQVGTDNTLTVHARTELPVSKNGYLYIYTSNETPNIDVFFDNLQVSHIRGPLLEETHYYPFGLIMAGISAKATAFGNPPNRYKFNEGTELASKEFSDGGGLELYETEYRAFDPQIGRLWQIDPMAEESEGWSPYAYANNNPILLNDPLGLKPDSTRRPGSPQPKPAPGFINTPETAPVIGEVVLHSSINRSGNSGFFSFGGAAGGFTLGPPGAYRDVMKVLPAAVAALGSRTALWGIILAGSIWASVEADALARRVSDQTFYITYYKIGPNGQIYVGRCSGIGKTADDVLAAYDKKHRMKKFNYGNAIMDKQISGKVYSRVLLPGSAKFVITTISGYSAIRGREQQLYDDFKLKGFTMGNSINPVWRLNPFRHAYWGASTLAFGPLRPYGATY